MLDFPNAPTNGQIFNSGTGGIYVWDGTSWNLTPGSLLQAPVASDTPPSSPYAGQLWFKSSTGALYMWYVDANSSQWVQIPGATVYTPPQAWELVGKYDLTGASPRSFTGLGNYKTLRLTGQALLASSQQMNYRTSPDNGATWYSGATDYSFVVQWGNGTNAQSVLGNEAQARIGMAATYHNWTTTLFNFNQAVATEFSTLIGAGSATIAANTGTQHCRRAAATVENALQILTTGAAISSGYLIIEGARP